MESRDGMRLSETGQVYVTERAAKTYAEALGMKLSEARHELTELLMEAHQVGESIPGELESWRYRSRTEGLDISARVARKPNLAEVVAVNVRFDMPRRGGKRHRE